MTRKERLLAAARRQTVDRVPYCTYNLHPYAGSCHTGDPSYKELLDFVRTTGAAMAKVGMSGLGVGLSRFRPGIRETRVEGQGDDRVQTVTVHTPKGDLTEVTRVPEDKPGRVMKPLLADDQDIEKYLSLPYEPPEFDPSPVRRFYDDAGDRAMAAVMYGEPMYSIASLLDFEDFSVRCITDLPAVLRLIDWGYERCANNLQLMLRECRGMECVFHTGGPEICTPPMLSPKLFPQLITPYLSKLVRMIHDAGQLAGVHCHGRVRHVLPELIRAEIDLLEPIEPPDQGDITLQELLHQGGGRLCFMGHIQDQELYTARPGEMARKVEAIARVVDGRTGYIMSPTCTPFEHPCTDTYRRNYMEWMTTAERVLAP